MEGQEFAQPQAPDAKMSVQEAEAVFALWTQLQEQQGPYNARPTLRDMAEALNIPESEVAIMLQKVRSQAPPIVAPQKTVKKGLHPMAIAAMAVAGIMILSGTMFAGMLIGSAGSRVSVFEGAPVMTAPMPNATVSDMAAPSTAVRDEIPANTSISIGEYKLEGTNQAMMNPDMLEQRIADGLLLLLPTIHPSPTLSYTTSDSELEAVREGLASQTAVKGLVSWEDIVVKSGKDVYKTKIPYALVDNDDLLEMVRSAQIRALRLAANHASLSANQLLAPK